MEVEVLDRLVSEERVALVLREVATRGAELLELRRVNLYRVIDGKIRAIEIFEATLQFVRFGHHWRRPVVTCPNGQPVRESGQRT